jgi:hypothetical protein
MLFNKYNVLIYLTAPVLILFFFRIIDNYKRRRISFKSTAILLLFWLILTTGLIFNKYLFDFIRSSKLSDSTPLSLYDVVQISLIIFLIYIAFRHSFKIEELKNKITKLNQEIALREKRDR